MRLSLGTAQFGLDYGITNAEGQVSAVTATAILKTASQLGVGDVDTASAYGTAEQVLADNKAILDRFCVTSKIPSLAALSGREAVAAIARHARYSHAVIGPSLSTLLLHDVNDLLRPEGLEIWAALDAIAAELEIKQLGISVYDAKEITAALKQVVPGVVQVPFSVFDQRLLEDGSLDMLARYGCSIEARSVFLQGLVLTPPTQLPYHLRGLTSASRALFKEAETAGVSPMSIALGFLRLTQRFDRAVIGVTHPNELKEICAQLNSPIPSVSYPNFRVFESRVVDPRAWPLLMEEKRAS